MNLLKVPIVEIFESFQGEGRFAGQRALFIRFAGCNLAGKCKYCDTDFKVREMMTVHDIAKRVYDYYNDGGRLVVFTGGEPAIYKDVLSYIMYYTFSPEIGQALFNMKYQIETNGMIRLPFSVVDKAYVSVSPKKGYHEDAIKYYSGVPNADFKFVVGDVPDDSTFWKPKEIKKIVRDMVHSYNVSLDRIWLMPYGANRDEIIKNSRIVWKLARKLGVNYSDRIHIRVWGRSLMGV